MKKRTDSELKQALTNPKEPAIGQADNPNMETYKSGYLNVLSTFPLQDVIEASVRHGFEYTDDTPEGLVFGNESAYLAAICERVHYISAEKR